MKVCVALILLSFSWMAGAADVPFLSARVVDNAQLLSAEAKTRIGAALKAHEDKTTNQLVVLTIPSLDGESIEPFATKVFEKWKPGRKGKDNGAILIVVPQERKLRIEVGYGLEGAIPDGAAGDKFGFALAMSAYSSSASPTNVLVVGAPMAAGGSGALANAATGVTMLLFQNASKCRETSRTTGPLAKTSTSRKFDSERASK